MEISLLGSSPAERDDLIAFLESLTDEALLRDPRFADRWPVRADASR